MNAIVIICHGCHFISMCTRDIYVYMYIFMGVGKLKKKMKIKPKAITNCLNSVQKSDESAIHRNNFGVRRYYSLLIRFNCFSASANRFQTNEQMENIVFSLLSSLVFSSCHRRAWHWKCMKIQIENRFCSKTASQHNDR